MNFLVDAQLPPALCGWLSRRGHQAVHVFQTGMVSATDAEIAARAAAENEILVSKDEDFVTLRLPDRFALPWLRCGNAENAALFAWLDMRWAEIEHLLETERFVEAR